MDKLPPELLRRILGIATGEHDESNDVIWNQPPESRLCRDGEWVLQQDDWGTIRPTVEYSANVRHECLLSSMVYKMV